MKYAHEPRHRRHIGDIFRNKKILEKLSYYYFTLCPVVI